MTVCTSTLAQGVNLPIRYLIVTSVYQAGEQIKSRDFQNLLGRAGRAGMHTEGSVLFADPTVFDKRKMPRHSWRWRQVIHLLDPANSKPTGSNLLTIFEPLQSDDEKSHIAMEALDFVRAYAADPKEVAALAARLARRHRESGFTEEGVSKQVAWRLHLVAAVESFLLAHWNSETSDSAVEVSVRLVEGTLAYYLADDEQKKNLRELFAVLSANIRQKVSNERKIQGYGRTLLGLQDALAVEDWLRENVGRLEGASEPSELLESLWDLFEKFVQTGPLTKLDSREATKQMAQEWLKGAPFGELHARALKSGLQIHWGKKGKKRRLQVEHVVEFCEKSLGFEASLLVGAVCETYSAWDVEEESELVGDLLRFQKQLKYGLADSASISIYELGFSERVVAQELARGLGLVGATREGVRRALKDRADEASAILSLFPSYFQHQLERLQ